MLVFNKGILSWSLMPGMLCVLSMTEGFVVRKSSRMFLPLVGSRTACTILGILLVSGKLEPLLRPHWARGPGFVERLSRVFSS